MGYMSIHQWNFLWVCLIFSSKNGQWSAVATNPWVWVFQEVFPWCWGWGRQTWFQTISYVLPFGISFTISRHKKFASGERRCNQIDITSSAPRETRTAQPTSTEQNWETKGNHKEHSLYPLDFWKFCPCFFPASQQEIHCLKNRVALLRMANFQQGSEQKGLVSAVQIEAGGFPSKKTTGWWYTYPSEKYKSQMGVLFLRYGKS